MTGIVSEGFTVFTSYLNEIIQGFTGAEDEETVGILIQSSEAATYEIEVP